ncbi:MAG: MMPL family transporter [Candidatus Omnitrophota bacterium]|nr:MMPL family transporter [Candidatus Omnitrophota bacterium]
MFRLIAKFVLLARWPLILALFLATGIAGWSVLALQIDPTIETLFVKNSAEYEFYREYRERYGSDHLIAIAVETEDMFSLRNLRRLRRLTETLESFEEVERVLSLANASDIRHKFMGVKVEPVLEGVFDGKRDPQELKADIVNNELFRHNLISTDGRVANVLVFLKGEQTKRSRGQDFVKRLRRVLEQERRPGFRFYLAGAPIEQHDFVDLIRKDQFTFVPMITMLLVVATFVIYRSLACTFLAMSLVFMTLIWTMGTISLLGEKLNLVTSLLPPVIMIITVVNSIHLMNLFFEVRPHHPSLRRCVVLTMEQLGVPCLLTHLTTILGFISLLFNPVPAIRDFGIFAALGTFYSYIAQLLLTPILLPALPYRIGEHLLDETHYLNRIIIGFLEKLEYRWKWIILGLAATFLGLSIYGMTKLEVDTNLIKQMRPDSQLAISTRFIDENLTGVYSLGFVMRAKDGKSLVDADKLKRLDAFKDFLESNPEIPNVNSITTLIKRIHAAREGSPEAYFIPEDQDTLEKYMSGMVKSGDPELWKLISPDLKEVRIEGRMKAVGTKDGARVEAMARAYLDEKLSDVFESRLTGSVVLLGRMAKDLIGNQMRSFVFAFGSILILIALLFRSVRIGLLAAIPNVLPIIGVYGIMGFMHIELSSPTAMISSIVLGLVVDASIHFLHRFKLEFQKRQHYLQALHHTYRNVGQAMVVSTSILVVGFASSVFAAFRPTIHFGVLTGLTIFFALICTLLILPVCVVMTRPFGEPRVFDR